jgi:hypothetical protein
MEGLPCGHRTLAKASYARKRMHDLTMDYGLGSTGGEMHERGTGKFFGSPFPHNDVAPRSSTALVPCSSLVRRLLLRKVR